MGGLQLHWHNEPFLLITVLSVVWIYLILTGPLRATIAGPGVGYPKKCAISFFCGVAIGYLAVASPLDQLGEDYLLTAHMIQHNLLIYIVPPLLIMGIPVWLSEWSFRFAPWRIVFWLLTRSVVAGLLFVMVFTMWHFPVLYEAALRDKWLHILEHATMMGTAFLVWWVLISRSPAVPALAAPLQMLFVFFIAVGHMPIIMFLISANQVLYPTYEFAPRLFESLDPLEDQIVGGLLMSLANFAFSMLMFARAFYCWYTRDPSNSSPFPGFSKEFQQKKHD
jgi:putative membrane protein